MTGQKGEPQAAARGCMGTLDNREIVVPVGDDFVRRLGPVLERIIATWPLDEQGQPVLSDQAIAAARAAVGPVMVEAIADALENHLQKVEELVKHQPSMPAEQILDLAGTPDAETDEAIRLLFDRLSWLTGLLTDRRASEGTTTPQAAQTTKPESSPAIFQEGHAAIPTPQALYAVLEAIHNATTRKGWDDYNGDRVPTHTTKTNKKSKEPGAVYVSVRSHDGRVSTSPDVLAELWAQVEALDDLTSDTMLACLARWAKNPDPATPVWIDADAILDARGIKRIQRRDEPGNWQHGHRTEDRLAVARALAQLDALWLEMQNVEVTPPGKRRKAQRLTHESRALAMLYKIVQQDLDGSPVVLAARVMPGSWADAYRELNLKQRGLLAQKALTYDLYKRQPEKRLAKYLAFHYRYNADSPGFHRRVADLLEIAGIDPDHSRPQRTRDRLDLALNRLQEDSVIGRWEPILGAVRLPARGWFAHWLQTTVAIKPPANIQRHYAKVRR